MAHGEISIIVMDAPCPIGNFEYWFWNRWLAEYWIQLDVKSQSDDNLIETKKLSMVRKKSLHRNFKIG